MVVVAYGRGMGDERFRAAQTWADVDYFELAEKGMDIPDVVFYLEGDYAAEAVHLGTCDGVMRVAGEAGIVGAPDRGVRFEKARHGKAVFIVAQHPEFKGFEAPYQKIG